MKISEISINRPSLVVVLFSALTILGVLSYRQLSYELLPKFTAPTLTISTVYPGASPSEVENSVTKVIEDAVSTLERVKRVRSTSFESLSLIIVEFESSVDIEYALNDCQRKIDQIMATFPDDSKQPSISKISPDDFPILKYSLSSNMSSTAFYQFVKDKIKPMLNSVKGVGDVIIVGGEERAIRVNVDDGKLKSYNLSLLQVSQAIGQGNLDFPTGKLESGGQEIRVRLGGKFLSIDDLRNLVVAKSEGASLIKLSDIADVTDGIKDLTTINRINGKNAIGLYVKKQPEANAVEVAALVKERVKKSEEQYSDKQLKFTLGIDTSEFTVEASNAVKHDLVLAIFLVAAVVLLFLHTLKDSLIVMIAVPLSFVATFIAIYLFGYTLNLMTMMGLTLVVGILVDDSIVVLENIHRHLEMGKKPFQAALDGVKEIGFTAIAITMVIVSVFLPLALSNAGVVSVILRNFSWVIVVATLLSLLVSFTVIPWLVSRFSGKITLNEKTWWGKFNIFLEKEVHALTQWYETTLAWALKRKALTFAVVTVLFIGSMSLVASGFIGSSFIENGDRGEVIINIEVDKTSSLENTSRISQIAEQRLLMMPEVKTVLANVGGSSSIFSPGSGTSYKSELTVKLIPLEERKISTDEWLLIAKEELRKITGVKPTGSPLSITGGAFQPPVEIVISGSEQDSVLKYGAIVKEIIKNTAGTTDVAMSIENGVPEVKVMMDKEKMAALGLNVSIVGATLQNAYSGNDDSKFKDEDTEYDIIVMMDGFNRQNAEDVKQISFLNNRGEMIKLSQFATVTQGIGPSQLERNNRVSSVIVNSQLRGRQMGNVVADIQKTMAQVALPKGISTTYIGEYERQQEGFGAIGGAFGISIILIYLLMVALYDNYVYPLVVLFSVPAAFIGAFLALALTKSNFSIFTMMGVVVLIGLVCKNAILLVDFANKRKADGMNSFDALVEAGRERLRPILMTTLAMVFGMLAVAMATGPGSDWKNGLGWVLVGGLTSSMVLTLFIVPVVYLTVDLALAKIFKPKVTQDSQLASPPLAS